jgi:PAS domain-containing protein
MTRILQEPDFRALFESGPTALLIVLPDDPVFTMVAASDAYLRLSGVPREDLIGRGVFEVFRDNPKDPAGAERLCASFRRTIATNTPDRLSVCRYDLELPESGGDSFEERYWSALNTPRYRREWRRGIHRPLGRGGDRSVIRGTSRSPGQAGGALD